LKRGYKINMDKAEYAQDFLKQGYSCSQSVLSAFIDQFDLDRDTVLRISSAFGGGMGGLGGVCGAVTAAFMVIGLKYGSATKHDDEEMNKISKYGRFFMNEFKFRNGSTLCRDLLGMDIGTLEGFNEAKAKGLFENICPDIVRCSIEIVEEMISD
jgi:C_GCAxxG_C_C family probable redox protein